MSLSSSSSSSSSSSYYNEKEIKEKEEITPLYDVIVIGGGISGVITANTLLNIAEDNDFRLRVCLIEADDRLGGRTKTIISSDGFSIDLGGQWINKQTQIYITRIINSLGLKTKEQFHVGKKVMETSNGVTKTFKGTIPPLPILSLLDFQFRLLRSAESKTKYLSLEDPSSVPSARQLDSMTVENWMDELNVTDGCRQLVDIFCKCIWGVDCSEVSMLFFLYYVKSGKGFMSLAEIKNGAQQDKIIGGTQQISERIAQEIEEKGGEVRINEPVTHICREKGVVQVRTKTNNKDEEYTNTITARKIVLAIPPNMMEHIEFVPELPISRLMMCQRLFMGSWMKIILRYDSPWWRTKGFSGELICNNEEKPLLMAFDNCTIPEDDSLGFFSLVVFICSRGVWKWGEYSKEERQEAIVSQLVEYFGNNARDVIEYYEHNWNKHKWTKGCPVNMFPPGLMELAPLLREPIDDVMFFAGTETATEWMGYMDGAVQSGERAANEVARELGLRISSQFAVENILSHKECVNVLHNRKSHGNTFTLTTIIWIYAFLVSVVMMWFII